MTVPPDLFFADPLGQYLCASGAMELALRRAGGQLPFVGGIERTAPRNAGGAPPTRQAKLREQVRGLVDSLGYRPDFLGTNPPWQVPWTPVTTVGEIVRWLSDEGARWLDEGSIPDEARQAGFIRRYLAQVADTAGIWQGSLFMPVAGNYETAPLGVISKAPRRFPAALAPVGAVLKPEPCWRFWFSAQALAVHFDALAGAPTKLEIFEESLVESVRELPRTFASAASAVGSTVERMVGLVIPWKPILIAGGVIAGLVVLPRFLEREGR